MLWFEWVSAAYFLFLILGAVAAPAARRRRLRAVAASAAIVLSILAVSDTLPREGRVWLPLLYLPLGYWLPAMLTTAGESRFEVWLRRHDTTWRRHVAGLPPAALGILELAYLACYVVVPLAFMVVWSHGTAEQIDAFWVAVLLAGFSCYITLPWLVSRPPRTFFERPAPPGAVAAFNMFVLRAVSHQFNTFPSGHVSVATAAALMLLPVSSLAGLVFGAIAAGIAAGAAIGRYHYAIDVVAGAVVGTVAALAAW